MGDVTALSVFQPAAFDAAAVRQLLAQGYPVRAFVHRQDERAHALRRAGPEIFVGDMLDLRDLRNAMIDMQRAYFCAPMLPNHLHTGVAFAMKIVIGEHPRQIGSGASSYKRLGLRLDWLPSLADDGECGECLWIEHSRR